MNESKAVKGPPKKKQLPEYYLDASADPKQIICKVTLTESNYERWETLMRIALKAKSKVGFIHGVIKKPHGRAKKLKMWDTVNSMLVSWILNCIDPELRSSLPCPETAFKLWQHIRERFSILLQEKETSRQNKALKEDTKKKEETKPKDQLIYQVKTAKKFDALGTLD